MSEDAIMCQELSGVARNCLELSKTYQDCQGLLGVVRDYQGLSGIIRGCQGLPGVARSSHEDVLEAVRIARMLQELPVIISKYSNLYVA